MSDSLTNFINSIQNLTSQQGQSAFNTGQQQEQSGVNAAAPALDYLTKMTKGDQGDVTQAAQPQIDQITQQFDQIRNMVSMQPRGGGKTSALAEAPFKKSGDIARTEGAMRTNAAGELGNLSTQLAGIGLSESSIGAGLESTASNTALTRRGQNIQENENLLSLLI